MPHIDILYPGMQGGGIVETTWLPMKDMTHTPSVCVTSIHKRLVTAAHMTILCTSHYVEWPHVSLGDPTTNSKWGARVMAAAKALAV